MRLGNKPLVVAPVIEGTQTAVIGGRSAVISRKGGETAAFTGELLRASQSSAPIYELDEEELLEYEATQSALSVRAPADEYIPPMEPPLQPVPPPDQPEPLPPPDQPSPNPEPASPPDPQPITPPPPEQPPDVEPAAREEVALFGALDRPSLAYFERVFTGSKPPVLLDHFILAGALACARDAQGFDGAGLRAHLDEQAQLLQRIALHRKMAKVEPIGNYAGQMTARVDRCVRAPLTTLEPLDDPNMLRLQTELSGPALTLLTTMQEESARWDFTKARQLTLALQARRVAAHASLERIHAAEHALSVYAQASALQLQRFLVRMRIDRTTALLFAPEPSLDPAAQALIGALGALFAE